jgi:hypothetical protein
MEAGEHPKWRNIIERSPISRSYYAQWYSLVMRESVLEHHWESTDRRPKRTQVVLPLNEVKEVLEEVHERSLGGSLDVSKILDKVIQRYYRLHVMVNSVTPGSSEHVLRWMCEISIKF